MENNKELVFNIWFIVDIGTKLVSHCYLKPYYIQGNDDDKINILTSLAETDFLTCERFAFVNIDNVNMADNLLNVSIDKGSVNQYFNEYIDVFIDKMELDLPPVITFKGDLSGENKVTKQKFPQQPLYVLTFLMENEVGDQKPFTTAENKKWAINEEIRIDDLSKVI